MSPISNPAIPKGATVLVTGANGFIGSHVADQFLANGYNVRGTVRDPKKHTWLSDLFEEKYGKGVFQLIAVPDMVTDGAFDDAVKGVSGVVHVASNLSFDPDPNKVVPGVIAGALNTLKAAAKEPSVKRFVLTSSSTAALTPQPGKEIIVDENTWNEATVKDAWRDPPYEPERGVSTYGASKMQSEQEVWKWYRENKPNLVVNTVLPNANFGRILSPAHQGYPTTPSFIKALWEGKIDSIKSVVPQYFIDVQDDALLHVAAVIHPDVKDQRIFGFAAPYTFNDILAIFRKLHPERKFPDDFHEGHDLSKILPSEKAEALLKEFGRPGWTSLEESIKKNIEQLV